MLGTVSEQGLSLAIDESIKVVAVDEHIPCGSYDVKDCMSANRVDISAQLKIWHHQLRKGSEKHTTG